MHKDAGCEGPSEVPQKACGRKGHAVSTKYGRLCKSHRRQELAGDPLVPIRWWGVGWERNFCGLFLRAPARRKLEAVARKTSLPKGRVAANILEAWCEGRLWDPRGLSPSIGAAALALLVAVGAVELRCASVPSAGPVVPRHAAQASVGPDELPESFTVETLGIEHGDCAEQKLAGIIRSPDGAFFAVEGSCDTTGWDCQASLSIQRFGSFDDAHALGLTDEGRRILKERAVELAKGCDPRKNTFTTEGGDPIRLSCTCGYRAEAKDAMEAYRLRVKHTFPAGLSVVLSEAP